MTGRGTLGAVLSFCHVACVVLGIMSVLERMDLVWRGGKFYSLYIYAKVMSVVLRYAYLLNPMRADPRERELSLARERVNTYFSYLNR